MQVPPPVYVNSLLLLVSVMLVNVIAPVLLFVSVTVCCAVSVGSVTNSILNGVGVSQTDATAAAASTMPAPQVAVVQSVQPVKVGNGRALACSLARISAGVSAGLSDNMSETTPVTCGAAMLVP